MLSRGTAVSASFVVNTCARRPQIRAPYHFHLHLINKRISNAGELNNRRTESTCPLVPPKKGEREREMREMSPLREEEHLIAARKGTWTKEEDILLRKCIEKYGEGKWRQLPLRAEYAMGGKASTEGDVYSYGILLLEMVTGKEPTDDMFKDNLSLRHFSELALPERVMEIVDLRLLLEEAEVTHTNENHINTRKRLRDCLISMVRIGVLCSMESPKERMKMKDVATEMHAIKDLYLGVRIYGDKQVRSQVISEGPSYLSHY